MANTWRGAFPLQNLLSTGYEWTPEPTRYEWTPPRPFPADTDGFFRDGAQRLGVDDGLERRFSQHPWRTHV